jgi:amino-acid N-acetyltransferase
MRDKMIITKAKVYDLPKIFGLLRDNGLAFDGVAKDLRNFLVIKEGREIIGCAGFEIHGGVGLLRSVAVKKERQGQGLGGILIKRLLDTVRKRGIKRIYLLTDSAHQFFSKYGFERIERNTVDPIIQQTEGFTHCCPCSSTIMIKHLNTEERDGHIPRRA